MLQEQEDVNLRPDQADTFFSRARLTLAALRKDYGVKLREESLFEEGKPLAPPQQIATTEPHSHLLSPKAMMGLWEP